MRTTVMIFAALALCAGAAPLARTIQDDPQADGIIDTREGASRAPLEFDYQFGVGGFSTRNRFVPEMPDLFSGDRFTVRLRAREAVYAYLFVSNSDGGVSLVVPDRDVDEPMATHVDGRQWVALPDDAATLRLDEHRGVEHVYLVVSRLPVSAIEGLDRDTDVTPAWLRRLQTRGGSARRSRQHLDDFVRASYSGTAVAFEEVTFRHR